MSPMHQQAITWITDDILSEIDHWEQILVNSWTKYESFNSRNVFFKKAVDAILMQSEIITMRSHGGLGVPNQRSFDCLFNSLCGPFDCLFNSLCGPTSKKHQSTHYWPFVRGTHRSPVNSPHKGPVTWKKLPFDDVIIWMVKRAFMRRDLLCMRLNVAKCYELT